MASLSNRFLLLSCILFFIISSSIARTPPSLKSLILPVLKDKCSKQYTTQFSQGTPLVPVKLTVDLGNKFTWVDCDNYVSSSYRPASCGSVICKLAGSYGCSECYSDPKPGCNNITCGDTPYNPIIGLSTSGDIGQDAISIRTFDGKNIGKEAPVPAVPFLCGTGFMLENLADGVSGIAGLGWSNVSLPAFIPSAIGFSKKFSLCLSSLTNASGAIIFGDGIGPNSIIPSDVLAYTPLVRNPVSTAGSYSEGDSSTDYFISLKSIRVGGKEIKFNKTLLSINNEGKGGTRISTVHPYTILHTDIYKAVLKAFVKQMGGAFQKKPPTAPFGVCFLAGWLNFDERGPVVPMIDLVMEAQGSVYWRIWGANSMVKIHSNEWCLGIVDGGTEPESSIIIGAHQMEDNLVQFDHANSRLGFSSSLLFRNTTCADFKF